MADQRPRPTADSEKITIHLGVVDLGQIDLLVQEGFYSNRTDLIRTAIRNQLAIHGDALRHSVARRTLVVGLQDYGRRELEAARDAGERLRIQALGLVRIADDVTPELALEVIESITVLGVLQAAPRLRAALAGRIH